MYFLWKHFVSVSSNRQSVVWLRCDTDSRISLYRLTYYYICSKRDAWNRALPFITLHVCSHVIWRSTKWVPCTQWCVNKARNQHHPYQRRGKASIRVFVLCVDRKIMQCTDRWFSCEQLIGLTEKTFNVNIPRLIMMTLPCRQSIWTQS